ncbi:protein-L-isoaspartate(D-aspartate) O-methyltransferase [Paracoccaceae bacterium GXU_MW_L88]
MTNTGLIQLMMALRGGGVTNSRVLNAMERTPRDLFVEGTFKARAWEDTPLPIPRGQTISQPSLVGRMTQALDVQPRHKVLEIGTGSGWQAAILARLARRVYTLERHKPLIPVAEARFAKLNISNITAMPSDGTMGLPAQAPFDRIMVTAAAEDVPPPLTEQLATGGIMVIPVGLGDYVQTIVKVLKTDNGLEYEELGEVRFVPLLEGMAEDEESRE